MTNYKYFFPLNKKIIDLEIESIKSIVFIVDGLEITDHSIFLKHSIILECYCIRLTYDIQHFIRLN